MQQEPRQYIDISNEYVRTYVFIREGKEVGVSINYPALINVSESGGHRIVDVFGVSHYIPTGWVSLSFVTVPGTEKFRF